MISENILNSAANMIVIGLRTALLPRARQNELKWQEQVHRKVPGIAMPTDNPGQYTDEDGNFKADTAQAEGRAKMMIDVCVGNRLKGAIAHYQLGNQMECVRRIVLALDTVFTIVGWDEASAWCYEQNRALYQLHKKKAA